MKLLAIFLILLIPAVAMADTYYICPDDSKEDCQARGTGWCASLAPNDINVGSKAAPFKNPGVIIGDIDGEDHTLIFSDGIYQVDSGDEVILLDGITYITLRAENKHGAIIDGSNQSPVNTARGFRVNTTAAHHVVIDGFEIRNFDSSGFGIKVDTHDITIKNCWIHDLGGRAWDSGINPTAGYGVGIGLGPSTYNFTIDKNLIHDTGRNTTGCPESTADCWKHDHGIYARGKYHTITNNVFHSNRAGKAITVRGADDSKATTASHIIVNNTFGPGDGTGTYVNGFIGFSQNSGDDYCYNDVIVENNVFYDCPGPDGLCLNCASEACDQAYIYDNVFNKSKSGLIDDDQGNMTVYWGSPDVNDYSVSLANYYLNDPDNNDYAITEDSSFLIDQMPANANSPSDDINEEDRDAWPDRGAYEYSGTPSLPTTETIFQNIALANVNFHPGYTTPSAPTCTGTYGTTSSAAMVSNPVEYRMFTARITLDCPATSGQVCATLEAAHDASHEIVYAIYDDDAGEGDNGGLDGDPFTKVWSSTATFDAASESTPTEICIDFTATLEIGDYWVGYILESTATEYERTDSGGVGRHINVGSLTAPATFPLTYWTSSWDRSIWLNFGDEGSGQTITDINWTFALEHEHGSGADQWNTTWHSDDNLYSAWGDGRGWAETGDKYDLGVTRIVGATGAVLTGTDYLKDPDADPNYKPGAGPYSINGTIYLFYEENEGSDWSNTWYITSTDNGVTWDSLPGTKVFDGSSDGMEQLGWVHFGKGHTRVPDDVDSGTYVYGIFTDAPADNTLKPIYLGRVTTANLTTGSSWVYLTGLDGNDDPVWGTWANREAIIADAATSDAGDLSGPGWFHVIMVYNEPLEQYMTTYFSDKNSTLHVLISEQPWGPTFTDIHGTTFDDTGRRFTVQIIPKYISTDGTTGWMMWSGSVNDAVMFVPYTLTLN